jgi:hypothetical protein
MAARKPKKPVDDSGWGNRSSVSPQAAVFRSWKPKKGLSLPADEWDRRVGWRDSGKPTFRAKPYGGSLSTGGSGDGYSEARKSSKRKPLY